jgi:hypothetical protein
MLSRFDLEFPIECDDEYWEHPDPFKRFKQPPGIPSRVTFYILLERLMGLNDIVLRAVVCISDLDRVGPEAYNVSVPPYQTEDFMHCPGGFRLL